MCLSLAITCTSCKKSDSSTDDNRIPVETVKAVSGSISEEYTVSGVAKALAQAVITPKTPGKILAVYVQPGDTVSQGTLLCSLDKSDLAQSVATLNAQLEQADAGVDSALISSERAQGSGYEQTLMQA